MCKESNTSFFWVIFRYLWYKSTGRSILMSNRVYIKGLLNIRSSGLLQIGMNPFGFMNKYDRTFINVRGRLEFHGNYSIGRGCRFDIGPTAIATFGGGYVSPNTNFIIMHKLNVGDGCVISWDCQFLDDDFHDLTHEKKIEKDCSINVGCHVWIGSRVVVLKGSRIPDGCVVASGSVVCSAFTKENCLLAGNPAKIIRDNVSWR